MMNQTETNKLNLIIGISGIICFLTVFLQMPLYFAYEVPPARFVLSRILLGSISLVLLLVFFAGFQHMVRQSDKKYDWVATLIFGAVCVQITLNMVAHSLQAGAVFDAEGAAVAATTDGLLSRGAFLLYGTLGRLMTALFMLPIGIVILQTHLLPKWTGWLASIIGVINIAFIPSMFFGIDESKFYSAIGWGNSAFVASLYTYWVLAVSIVVLKKKPAEYFHS